MELECRGNRRNRPVAIRDALALANRETERPTLIIGKPSGRNLNLDYVIESHPAVFRWVYRHGKS